LTDKTEDRIEDIIGACDACGYAPPKPVGATFRKNRAHLSTPWMASITFDYRTIYIGYYKTAEEAHDAYKKKKIQLQNKKRKRSGV